MQDKLEQKRLIALQMTKKDSSPNSLANLRRREEFIPYEVYKKTNTKNH